MRRGSPKPKRSGTRPRRLREGRQLLVDQLWADFFGAVRISSAICGIGIFGKLNAAYERVALGGVDARKVGAADRGRLEGVRLEHTIEALGELMNGGGRGRVGANGKKRVATADGRLLTDLHFLGRWAALRFAARVGSSLHQLR
jgi:hypothetical protein